MPQGHPWLVLVKTFGPRIKILSRKYPPLLRQLLLSNSKKYLSLASGYRSQKNLRIRTLWWEWVFAVYEDISCTVNIDATWYAAVRAGIVCWEGMPKRCRGSTAGNTLLFRPRRPVCQEQSGTNLNYNMLLWCLATKYCLGAVGDQVNFPKLYWGPKTILGACRCLCLSFSDHLLPHIYQTGECDPKKDSSHGFKLLKLKALRNCCYSS